MPEIPLWKLKIDGQEYPPPQEGDESETQPVTPREEEFPHQIEGMQEWYDSRKEEYSKFLKTPDSSLLAAVIEKCLEDGPSQDFKTMRDLKGPAAWQVLQAFFDKCKDSTIVDKVVAELWKPALEWLQHEKHCQITMIEMKDLWKNLDDIDRPPAQSPGPEEAPVDPEYDDNFRFIGKGDEE